MEASGDSGAVGFLARNSERCQTQPSFFRCSYAYVSLSSQKLRDITISIEKWKRFLFYADTFAYVITFKGLGHKPQTYNI